MAENNKAAPQRQQCNIYPDQWVSLIGPRFPAADAAPVVRSQ